MRQLTSLLLGFGLTTGLLPRPVPFALAAPQDAPDPPLVACASESALMLNIDHLKGICVGQMGEQVSKVDDHLPGSCRTDGCARAVYRVHTGCSAFVHSSDFYKMFAQRLDSLKSRCDVDQAVAPIPTTPTFAVINGTKTAHSITGCGGTLIDRAAAGNGPNGVNWQQDITITAGVGLRVELAFQLLWLPTGTTIYVFDGDSKDSPSLGTVSDSCLGTPPTQKYTSSARSLTLRFITEPASNGQLMAFSATIGCVCTVGQAGCGTQGAGTCEATQPGQADGHCVCSDGWLSADCSDGSCRGMDCGAGHCTPVCKGASCQPAQCQCPEGFTGEKCALKSSECNEPEIKDNTIVLDSGQVRWSGCLAVLRPLHLFPPFTHRTGCRNGAPSEEQATLVMPRIQATDPGLIHHSRCLVGTPNGIVSRGARALGCRRHPSPGIISKARIATQEQVAGCQATPPQSLGARQKTTTSRGLIRLYPMARSW